jgi:hypothetical protein
MKIRILKKTDKNNDCRYYVQIIKLDTWFKLLFHNWNFFNENYFDLWECLYIAYNLDEAKLAKERFENYEKSKIIIKTEVINEDNI